MDINAVAEKIRKAVMDRAEQDGRVLHASAIEDEVRKVLALETRPATAQDATNILSDAAKQRDCSEAKRWFMSNSFGEALYKEQGNAWKATHSNPATCAAVTTVSTGNTVYARTRSDGAIEYVDRSGRVIAAPRAGTIVMV